MERSPFDWSPDAQRMRERHLSRIPLTVDRPRDPWTMPTIVAVALVALYFLWQFAGR